MAKEMRPNWLPGLAWIVLFYNLPVIAWGAFVRLSFSGDGCGSHWPDCDGSLVPAFVDQKTIIEFTHRIMSAVDGLLVLALFIAAIRFYGLKSRVGAAATTVLFFTIVEALLGRWLVKANLVGYDASVSRAVSLGVHLSNTFILIGSMLVLAVFVSSDCVPKLRKAGAVGWALFLGMVSLLAVSVSGTVTSLGDTLYPVSNTGAAIREAMNPANHFLIQLRILHPPIAVAVGAFIVLLVGLVAHLRPNAQGSKLAKWLVMGYGAQLGLGALAVFLKAPDWMAIVHLVVADSLWIGLVWFAMLALASPARVLDDGTVSAPTEKPTLKDYVALTKPRVISLLLFTTITALIAAAGGFPGWMLLVAVSVGGYLSAGAANAINMVIDRDIDGAMARTSTRPTVTHRISSAQALVFAFVLASLSFVVLWWAANLLTAALALAGLAFYVVVYTLILKRRTWHNIVIGGAAGAVPPLVGWAAVTDNLNSVAWILFAIVFVWTPVHFWALALMIKDDYAKANIPMLPVVKGDRATAIQILVYGVVTAAVSLAPALITSGGLPVVREIYVIGAILLNAPLLLLCVRLLKNTDRPAAFGLFKYSMVYLALLFLLFAVDRTQPNRAAQAPVTASAPSRLETRLVAGPAQADIVRNSEKDSIHGSAL